MVYYFQNENVGSHDRLAPVVHSAFITCSDGAGGFMEMLRGKLENIFLKCFITVFALSAVKNHMVDGCRC